MIYVKNTLHNSYIILGFLVIRQNKTEQDSRIENANQIVSDHAPTDERIGAILTWKDKYDVDAMSSETRCVLRY